MESSRITTSFFSSTRRLARSITISATCTWRAAGSSKVEGDDLALDRALHFGHFLGALVHQQHHQVHVGVVGRDGVGDVLHHHRLAALGRRDDQRALAFADGGDDVDDAAGDVSLALDVALQPHLLLGEQRRQVSNITLCLFCSGGPPLTLSSLFSAK